LVARSSTALGIPTAWSLILGSSTGVHAIYLRDPIGKSVKWSCGSGRTSPQVGLGSHYWLNIPKEQRVALSFKRADHFDFKKRRVRKVKLIIKHPNKIVMFCKALQGDEWDQRVLAKRIMRAATAPERR
jgi:hypothetical protein